MKHRVLRYVALIPVIYLICLCAHGQDVLDHWRLRDPRAVTKIRFVNNQFIALGRNGTILTSPDGKDWTARNSGTAADLRGVAWGMIQPFLQTPRFVVVGTGGTILTSTNTANWTKITTPYSNDLNDVVLGSLSFVAATTANTTSEPNFIYSYDTTTWHGAIVPWQQGFTPYRIDALATGVGNLVAAGGSQLADDIWFSWDDGQGWEKVGFANQIVKSTAFGNQRFIMIGINGFPLVSTNFGGSWSFSVDTNICQCYLACCYTGDDIVFGPSSFVVARDGQAYGVTGLLTTVDGIHWTNRQTVSNLSLSTISYGAGYFVGGGRSGIYRAEMPPVLSAYALSSSNAIDLTISGESGVSYRLQASSNFSLWTDIWFFTNHGPPNHFMDPIEPNTPARFYRVFSP
jgi:hypothetical protein